MWKRERESERKRVFMKYIALHDLWTYSQYSWGRKRKKKLGKTWTEKPLSNHNVKDCANVKSIESLSRQTQKTLRSVNSGPSRPYNWWDPCQWWAKGVANYSGPIPSREFRSVRDKQLKNRTEYKCANNCCVSVLMVAMPRIRELLDRLFTRGSKGKEGVIECVLALQ